MPWIVIYAVIAAVNLIGEATSTSWLIWSSKPLLMVSLIAYAIAARRATWDRPMTWLLLGLVAAFAGDVFLMLDGSLMFMAGLASFAAMQVCYIAAFTRVPGPGLVRAWKIAALPYVLFAIALNVLIAGFVGDLRIPVLVYSALLVSMGIAALDLVLRLPRRDGWRVAWGAGLFVISDALIAITRFGPLSGNAMTSVLVMATYIIGQGLIVVGFTQGQAVSASRSR